MVVQFFRRHLAALNALTIKMPGGTPPLCDMPLSLVSLTATVANLCRVPLSGRSEGKSFADLVRQPDSKANHGSNFAEYGLGNHNEKYMIRDGDYKYTYWVHDIDELYDLRSDPEEMRSLTNQSNHQATVAHLRRELFLWHPAAER